LSVQDEPDYRLLAFLHIAEKSAAGRFTIYRDLVDDDPQTKAIFEEILRDEVFHMNYTYTQLARVMPESYKKHVWRARATRVWKRYLRLAAALANVFGVTILTVLYFIVLPPFAWIAKRADRRAPRGWTPITTAPNDSPTRQY
jgi:hypothetical protein